MAGIVLVMSLCTAQAAEIRYHETYEWEKSPKLRALDENDAILPAVILKDIRTIEYFHDDESNDLMQYYTVHTRIRVNSNDAVEMYNKEYISMGRVREIVNIKARVVTKDRVKEVEEVELLDFEGSDDYSSFKYFAIEGVEVGSDVEFMYTLKMKAKLDGGREFFQSDEPRRDAEFHIICPDEMHFDIRSYNDFPEAALDTTDTTSNHYYIKVPYVPPLQPENYAPYNNALMRVEFKLDYLEPATDDKLYTYDQIATQLHYYLRKPVTKKAQKKLKKLSKELEIDKMDQFQAIRRIEDYLKTNFTIMDDSGPAFENLEEIFENRYCNNRGIIRLFIGLFDMAGIPYEYGLTSDRTDIRFDPDFESYSFLEDYIFYFPDIDQFMAPTEMLFRVGYIPFNWTDNYGLFIYLDDGTILDTLRYIPPLAYEKSRDNISVYAEFTDDFSSLLLDVSREMTGYQSTFLQPIFQFIPDKETNVVVTELLNMTGKDVNFDTVVVRNTSPSDLYVEPLYVQGIATTNTAFFDRAGSKHLFRIGELIGKQVELYQERERKLPVENEYNRIYERTIRFKIPEGYSVSNLEDLKAYHDHREEGEITMAFDASYEWADNVITVYVKEFYKKLHYSLDEFEEFREVINAAADFNKKILVFEKTS
jgi:hypothetical protein